MIALTAKQVKEIITENALDSVVNVINKTLTEDLPQYSNFHYTKDYKIRIIYKDEIHPDVQLNLQIDLDKAGYQVSEFFFENGQTVFYLYLNQ